MNLSKLTNPAEPEIELGISHNNPYSNHDITSAGTQTDVGSLETDSRTVSSNVAHVTEGEEEYDEDEDEYNAGTDNYENENKTEIGVGSDKDNNHNSSDPETGSANSSKRRSTAEYRTLYHYLLEKYKNANHTSKVLEEFELYLKKLSKYQQLRNNMIIDSLRYIDKHESFESIDNLSHSQLETKLASILKNNERMKPLVSKLLDLEKVETSDDSRANLNAFHNLIGINDSLSSDLAIQESNVFPDLYTSRFDFFELVKKNQRFENNIESYMDLRNQIKSESNTDLAQAEQESSLPRKRSKQSASSSNKLVSRSERTENSLKITIQRKKRKVADEPRV